MSCVYIYSVHSFEYSQYSFGIQLLTSVCCRFAVSWYAGVLVAEAMLLQSVTLAQLALVEIGKYRNICLLHGCGQTSSCSHVQFEIYRYS